MPDDKKNNVNEIECLLRLHGRNKNSLTSVSAFQTRRCHFTSLRSVLAVLVTVLLQTFFPLVLSVSEARSLTDVFVRGFSYDALGKNTAPAAAQFAPILSTAVAQAVTQEFPHASVSPAFTYRYNPALSVFERSTTVPGPLFSERALTLGQGQLNFGVGYSFVDFDELNRASLHAFTSPALLTEVLAGEAVPRGDGRLLAGVSGWHGGDVVDRGFPLYF